MPRVRASDFGFLVHVTRDVYLAILRGFGSPAVCCEIHAKNEGAGDASF